jgi:hypothetical protein
MYRLSPVVDYHGLARRLLVSQRLLMRPPLNGSIVWADRPPMSHESIVYGFIGGATFRAEDYRKLRARHGLAARVGCCDPHWY